MVNVTSKNGKFIFNIIGWHQIWSLHSQFSIPKESVVSVYQDRKELDKYPGWRVGTHIPYLITAGVFSFKGKRNFWDVMRRKNTIIVTLENQMFDKLYIEVANPQETINLLNIK